MTSLDDRIEGVLLATAAGDALGAPYEFGPARGPELEVVMAGGGVWEPGEWTDDTAMAVVIAEVAATGADLRAQAAQDAIVARWIEWAAVAKDVGIQTRSVLNATRREGCSAERARAEAVKLHEQTGRSGGNGSLMRTAPLALAYLDDEAGLVQAARMISELTHVDPDAGDACVLWSTAIRHAVLNAKLNVRIGLGHLDADRQEVWSQRLDDAETRRPADFANNGWVVAGLQAAWSAIATTPVPGDDPAAGVFRADHLRRALDAAVRAGNDTDTVAAIAGGLLGAAHGASAVPLRWRQLLHGWPGHTAHDLVNLAAAIGRGGGPDPADLQRRAWTRKHTLATHPYDDKVVLGGLDVLRKRLAGFDAVVSLCSLADDDMRTDIPHYEARLLDKSGPGVNPNLEFVLLDAVRAVEGLREQGKTVLLHCVESYSRTPTVAALYGARRHGVDTDQALHDIQKKSLPDANPNKAFRAALERLDPTAGGPRRSAAPALT